MTVGLQVDLEEIDRKLILRLSGRLDATSTPFLEKKINGLVDEGRSIILLDFDRVDYLSSAGMRLLLSTSKKMKAKSGTFALFSINEEVMEIIKLAGFEKILTICPSEKEALRYML